MDRSELTLAIAGALAGAFLIGWVLGWIVHRMSAGPRSAAHTADLAAQLHAAEDARHRAETLRDEIETAAAHRIAGLQSELDASRDAAARAEIAYRRAIAGGEQG